MSYPYEAEIEAVLDERVRPLLHTHGGDMEVLSLEDGVLRFRLLGHCAGCAAADITSEELINAELTEAFPERIEKAVLVNSVSPDLLDQAREILRLRHGS